jgi:hypothetical protein
MGAFCSGRKLQVERKRHPSQADCPPCVTCAVLTSSETRIAGLLKALVHSHRFNMQAIRLAKKYPQFQQDEVFDLINRFK